MSESEVHQAFGGDFSGVDHHESTVGAPHLMHDGGPETIRFIDQDGLRIRNDVNLSYDPIVDAMTDEDAQSLYRDMVLIRRMDQEGTALQRQGELGLWPGLLGQEAAQIGIGRAMAAQDYAFPGYREHGVAYCRGVDPLAVFGMYRGTSLGGWDPHDHNFHLYTIVIGNQALHAVGYAMGVQRDGDVATGDPERDTAVVAFFGDGATAQGDINEAFVFAAVNQCPVVFFCQNNQWAISEPNETHTRIPLYQRARGFGFPGVRVDGNDVVAVYAVATAALEHARSGKGPFLIEAFTYRMGAHTTSDDPTKYRDPAEVELWRERDPIERVRTHLVARGNTEPAFFDEVDHEADAFAATIRSAVQALPDPPSTDMFDHVYGEEHPGLAAERAEFLAYQAGFEGQDA
ncbi:3-methyl-2-oxobutanoate dehydrogenase subunit alpha [Austwickia sp. TVS 96-490-7B]|uniref:pyruvate dehydrogenase (acetyl-transferring) E1 component subunit alpha n=1 Tax=Austwickia sp. TVS 96-490-7B TaxID=2830843 RepID=UPI001C58B9BA|nr:pyruvate dehydrogenase (acetyl-transferring) E1 component subunit alpha [Austwickia sp. TVS 96-490-7B]MBW3085156.1 3-methyl-2-oxobutanoate dehydrogenase subunit alpha [Austwickia sp. TVS 96-490-7B]